MEDGSRLPFFYAVLLLFCAMYFAAAETAFASCSRPRIRLAEERGDARARKALYVLDHFDEAITAILIGTNIVHVSAAALVTLAVTRRWGLGAVSVSTLITTVVVFFAGEMLPKSIAKKFADKLALATSGALVFFMRLFRPLGRILTALGQAAARHTPGDAEKSVTEDELYDIIEDMTEEGSLNEEQGELISSALQFGDVTVENVLTPRVDLAALDVKSSHAEILACIKSNTHSRLPVYEGSIDNIIGILQIRKYIKAYLREGESLDIRSLLDKPFFVHQSTNIDELLPVMAKEKHNLAVVTDNFGGTLGIVTVEDILEELVGEIWDEDSWARSGTRTTWSRSPSSRSPRACSRSSRTSPSATCSSAWTTRTRRRTRSSSTPSWASGPMSSSPRSRRSGTASATTGCRSRSRAWTTTASSSCA